MKDEDDDMKDDFYLAVWTSALSLAGVFSLAMWVIFEMWR